MLPYLLLPLLFGAATASLENDNPQCMGGVFDTSSNFCYWPLTQRESRDNAYRTCVSLGGTLVNIKSKEIASAVSSLQIDNFWIGLTCIDDNLADCMWDDGTHFNVTYNYMGDYNLTAGPCFMQKGGYWYSAACDSKQYSLCSFDVTNPPPQCNESSYFNGNCYFSAPVVSLAQAEEECAKAGAQVVSIHSAGENTYLVQTAHGAPYLEIGLAYNNSELKWLDRSRFDYNNTGMFNPAFGSCMMLQTGNGPFASKGQWVSASCTSGSTAVCKKALGQPPISSAKCDGFQTLVNTGNFSSPGYPSASSANNCSYVVVEQGPAFINFTNIRLDENSFLYLYTSYTDTKPIRTLTNVSLTVFPFHANQQTPLIVFVTPGGKVGTNYFVAEYGLDSQN